MQRQQQKAHQRSESKGPKTCFWGSKRSQNREKSMSRSVPAAKWVRAGSRGEKRPKIPKLPPLPLFRTHFECFLGVIFRTFLEPPFFSFFWENKSPKLDRNKRPLVEAYHAVVISWPWLQQLRILKSIKYAASAVR